MRSRKLGWESACLVAAAAITACSGSPSAPTRTAAPPTVPTASGAPAPSVQPTIASVTPDTSSTDGGAWGRITGTDFQTRAIVRLDGVAVQTYVQDSSLVWFWTNAHAAGTVDVAVENPGGLIGHLAGAFTYKEPGAFDVNGQWLGHIDPDSDTDMPFTLDHGVLVSVACGASPIPLTSLATSVGNGEFAVTGGDGCRMSGRMVSASEATGEITTPLCPGTKWWAERR